MGKGVYKLWTIPSAFTHTSCSRRLADFTERRGHSDSLIAETAIALFVRFWLASTTSLPDAAQAAGRGKGGERYDKFLKAPGERVAIGPRLSREVQGDEEVSNRIPPRHITGFFMESFAKGESEAFTRLHCRTA
ncbi:hypothetical protein [Agrobacterium tumefaciens]|uniref:hypothetical protein n=1 Tax=Agrobacterium tumefaciens TaxID=358 RepID=UPI003BA1E4A7